MLPTARYHNPFKCSMSHLAQTNRTVMDCVILNDVTVLQVLSKYGGILFFTIGFIAIGLLIGTIQ